MHEVLVLVDKGELRGGGAGVDAQVDGQPRRERAAFVRLGQAMPLLEGAAFRAVGEERAAGAGGRGLEQPFEQPRGIVRVHEGVRVGEHAGERERRSVGHDGLGVLGPQDVLLRQVEALGERFDKARVERERAALEDDGRRDVGALGQAADGLLGDGVEERPGDVLLRHALVEQGLDVGLGVDAAAPGDVVQGARALGQAVELLDRHAQQRGDLVHQGAGAARARAVHAHVGDRGRARLLVGTEEDHLRVLPAQLDGGARGGVEGLQRERVGHDLLDVGQAQGVRDGARSRAGERGAHAGVGEVPQHVLKLELHALRLARAVTAVA